MNPNENKMPSAEDILGKTFYYDAFSSYIKLTTEETALNAMREHTRLHLEAFSKFYLENDYQFMAECLYDYLTKNKLK